MKLPDWWEADKPWIIGDFMDNTIPDNAVPLIFTSPPFKDEDVEGDYWATYDRWFQEMNRICSHVICIIHSATKIQKLMERYPPKRLMIWAKGVSKYSWRYNPIFVYQLDEKYNVNKRIWSDCIGSASLFGQAKEHKYQDPVLLYSTIIDMFKGLDPVLDPFCGSGTTMMGCKILGRQGLGYEIDPEYDPLICKRTLFGVRPIEDYFDNIPDNTLKLNKEDSNE